MSNDSFGFGRRAMLSGLTGAGLFPTVSPSAASTSTAKTAQSADTSSQIDWEWTHDRSPSTIYSLAVTPDGTLAAAGFEIDSSGVGTQELLLREIDANGREIGGIPVGSGGDEVGLGLTTTPSGELVFAGGSGTRGSNSLDTIVGRFETPDETSGITTAGIDGTNDTAHAIAADDSGVIVAGGTQYLGGADGDGVGRLVRLENGRQVWAETYGGGAPGELYDIRRTGTEFVVAGTRAVGGSGQAWLGVVGDGGTLRWEETYGGVGDRTAYSVVPAHDEGFVFAGTTTAPGQDTPLAWVGRVDGDGELLWEETYGTADGTAALAIERDPAQGYVVAGYTTDGGSEDGWLLHIDEGGRVVLEDTYGDSGVGRFQELLRFDDGYVAAGVRREPGAGPSGWILKTAGPASDLVEALSLPAERLSETLERHVEEREDAVLEEAYSNTDVLEDDVLPEVDTEEGVKKGLSVAIDSTKDLLINPGQYSNLKSGGALIAADIAEEVGSEALGNVLAGWTMDRLAKNPEQNAKRYNQYVADLTEHEWFLRPHSYTVDQPVVDHTKLDTYQEANESVRTLVDRIETFGQRPTPSALNDGHVESVFLQLAATLTDPAGIGDLERRSTYPTDLVVLPDGTVFNTQRGAGNLPAIQTAAEEYEEKGVFDWFSLGTEITGLLLAAASVVAIGVGVALVVIPEPSTSTIGAGLILISTGKSIGTAATVAGVASVSTDLLGSMKELEIQEAILTRHMQIHLETLRDIDNLGRIADLTVDWLDSQFDDPTSGTVAGTIDFPEGFDTTPDNPLKPSESAGDGEKELVTGEIDTEYEISGEASVPARILGFSSYHSGAGEDLPPLQGFATTSPPSNASPLQVGEGAAGRRNLDYVFHHPVEDQFRQHFFTVHLVLAGRHVDTATAVADVEYDPGFLSLPLGAPTGPDQLSAGTAEQSLQLTPYATADTPAARSMTAQEVDDLRGETAVLASERLDGGSTLSQTITVPGELQSAAFTLLGPPGASTELHLEGPTGTAVAGPERTSDDLGVESTVSTNTGGRQIAVYPSTETEVSLTVRVPPEEPRPVSVTLLQIDTPERPPVLGTNPTQLSLYGNPDEQIGRNLTVTEVGNQQAIEALRLSAGPLSNGAGTELAGETISADVDTDRIPASERTTAGVAVSTPEQSTLDGEPTRFAGTLDIDTRNAGSLAIPVSVLVLDSTVEEARLLDADQSVRRAAVRTLSPEEVPEPPAETLSLYRVTIEGSGSATVSFAPPEGAETTTSELVRLSDGSYESVDPDVSVRGTPLEFESGEHTVALLARTDDEESGTNGGSDDGGSDDGDGGSGDLNEGLPLSEEELAGAGLVTLSLLYLAARATSDDEGGR
ncbi:hypothetical protein [Halovenus sp. HT40]|uniref:hypothetical protein n=1 Tax=Halovenus sp. HT40 TaxID=3126691 RepID=UPI00300F55EE